MTSTNRQRDGGASAPSPADRFGDVRSIDERTRRTVLDSGLRVVSDSVPDAQSCSLSVWVGAGSRDEPAELAGASHFLEHLLFKGTTERSSHAINAAIDAVGGDLNAYTVKETTAFFARVPAIDQDLGAEVLFELASRPAMTVDDVEAERNVILEELAMVGDTPDDLIFSVLAESLYPGHPLGWEVLGRTETLESLTRDDLAGFFSDWYRPANLVVAAAGRVDHDALVAMADAAFGSPSGGGRPVRGRPGDEVVETTVLHRDTEQVHLAHAWRAPAHDHPDRYPLAVLNHIIGDGPSSRLYRTIRDDLGLAYSVFSTTSLHSDSGSMTIYCGTSPRHLGEVRTLVDATLDDIRANGVDPDELRIAIGYLQGSTVLGLEDAGSRMSRLGGGEISREGAVPIIDTLDAIGSVTDADLRRVAEQVFGSARATVVVGPVDGLD